MQLSFRPRRAAGWGLILFAGTGLAPDAAAQNVGTVTGIVVDGASLASLGRARVDVVEHERWVLTDASGRFSFEGLPVGDVTLRVSLEGYGTVVEQLTVSALELALIQFHMLRIGAVLDELLVSVHGDPPRGGAEARVSGDDISSMTAADLLAQRVPGLIVDRTSGAIGGGARVLIRGVSSMGGSNAPAIYLDGIRIDDRSSALPGSREPQSMHSLELIPASEVRQIRVLRGPAASARYAGASNGVILIETRRGDPGGR